MKFNKTQKIDLKQRIVEDIRTYYREANKDLFCFYLCPPECNDFKDATEEIMVQLKNEGKIKKFEIEQIIPPLANQDNKKNKPSRNILSEYEELEIVATKKNYFNYEKFLEPATYNPFYAIILNKKDVDMSRLAHKTLLEDIVADGINIINKIAIVKVNNSRATELINEFDVCDIYDNFIIWHDNIKQYAQKSDLEFIKQSSYLSYTKAPIHKSGYAYGFTNSPESKKLLLIMEKETRRILDKINQDFKNSSNNANEIKQDKQYPKSLYLVSKSIVLKDAIWLVIDEQYKAPIRFAVQNNNGRDSTIKKLYKIAYLCDAPDKKVLYSKNVASNINNDLFKKTAIKKYMKTNKLAKPTLVQKSESNTLVLKNEIVVQTKLINDVPPQFQSLYKDKTQ